MRNFKKNMVVLLMIIGFCFCLPLQSFAAEGTEWKPENKLKLSYQDNGTSLTGAKFSLYFVASVDEYGELTMTNDFSRYPVQISSESDVDWNTLASTLESYVLRDELVPIDERETDRQGMLSFPKDTNKLEDGLYLILGARHTQDGYIYDAQPFLVMLPTADISSNAWIYDVNGTPKYDKREEPVSPEDTKVDRKVLKVWNDKGQEKERPKQITIQLLRDGKIYDTVNLSDENQWRYTWKNLDASSTWTVAEQEMENYSVDIVKEGITFVVTNTFIKHPSGSSILPGSNPHVPGGNTKLPQTGQIWWPVPILFAVGLAMLMLGMIQRRGTNR